MRKLLSLLSLLIIVACTSKPVQVPTQPAPEPIEVKPAPASQFKGEWSNQEWTGILVSSIEKYGPAMLDRVPVDSNLYIKNFPSTREGRIQFYVTLISSMAYWESKWNPATSYTEPFNDAQGRRVVSRGLLQISIESGKGYGCVIPKAEDLHIPSVNIECGVKIVNRWLERDGRIGSKVSGSWRGSSRYFAVLSDRRPYAKTAWEAIRKNTGKL